MTILEHTEEKEEPPNYSYSAKPSNIRLAQALENKSMDEIIDIFDELLEAVEITNPRLYRKVAEKLQ